MTLSRDLLAALGVIEPAPEPAPPAGGWPLLAVAGVIGLIATAYLLRRQGDEE